MKKILKNVIFVSAVFLGLEITSCSDIETGRTAEISDISKSMTYNIISQEGFMGGSVLYNPDDESLGQLAKDVTIAFRLGHVSKTPTKSDEFVYADLPDEARFGTIHITEIDVDNIIFTSTLFSVDGMTSSEKTFSVLLNETADIDGDGLADIEYKMPSRKRAGFKKAVYLNFLSSQETLNTSMFAVLPEQYSGGSYPNGLLGINPDGKFIVRKYEDMANTARSVVAGAITGDYVLDTATGEYQRIISKGTRNARSIQDNELETVESEISISYYFSEEDFYEDFSADALYDELPTSVKKEEGSSVEKLNKVLENRDLIPLVKSVREIPIDDDIYGEVLSELATLSSDELVQLNRVFLEETYPEFCPQIITNSATFSEILPLVSVKFGLNDAVAMDDIENENSRSILSGAHIRSKSEYDVQKKTLIRNFETYKEIKEISLNTEKTFNDFFKVKLNNSYVSFGLKGSFSASWGSVRSELKVAAFFQANASYSFYKSFHLSDNILSSPLVNIGIPVFSVGPVCLNLEAGAKIGVPINIDIPVSVVSAMETNVSGLYGIGFSAGIDYGVKWKKKWFARYPRPYVDGSCSRWSTNKTIYYIATGKDVSFELNGASISLNPNFNFFAGANISGIIHGAFELAAGLKPLIVFDYKNSKLIGTAAVDKTLCGKLTASIGLRNIPIIKTISKSWEYKLFDESARIAEWQFLNK